MMLSKFSKHFNLKYRIRSQMKRVMTDEVKAESLMKRARETARPVCTLIGSVLVYCHLPNDWSLLCGIVKLILSCYSVLSVCL